MPEKPPYEELERKVEKLEKEIQKLRNIEKGFHDSEERFRIMVENSNDAIAILQDGVIKYANPKVVERSGFTPDRFSSMSFLDFVHPDDRALALERYNQRMKGEPVSESIVYKLIDKDGKPYWDYVSLITIVWDGKPAYMVVMTDITELKVTQENLKEAYDKLEQRVKERTAELVKTNEQLSREVEERRMIEAALKESEESLRTSQKTFETVLNHLDISVFASDMKNYEVLFANKNARGVFGDVVGKLCWRAFQNAETGPCLYCKNYMLLDDNGNPTGINIWETYSSLTDRWYEVRACAIYWVNGHVVRLSIATDITERREIEQKLRDREKELVKKTSKLEEVNTALSVLLKSREKDKTDVEEKILLNIRELVEPYLVKLMDSGLTEQQEIYASILRSNLRDVISPFMQSLGTKYLKLTPAEIQVANLIKQGRSTKEVARLLGLSARTIKFHRENIRRKIGIKNSKANLRTHLITIK